MCRSTTEHQTRLRNTSSGLELTGDSTALIYIRILLLNYPTPCSIEFYDELSKSESSVDSEGDSPAHPLPDFSVKVLQLSGLSLEVGSSSLDNVPLDQSIDGNNYDIHVFI